MLMTVRPPKARGCVNSRRAMAPQLMMKEGLSESCHTGGGFKSLQAAVDQKDMVVSVAEKAGLGSVR